MSKDVLGNKRLQLTKYYPWYYYCFFSLVPGSYTGKSGRLGEHFADFRINLLSRMVLENLD